MQNEIQVGRLSGILHKLLSMKEGAPSPVLATDIFPMLALEVDRPEWKFLGGERICLGGASTGATEAECSQNALYNPPGSGVIGIIETIRCFSSGGTFYATLRLGAGEPLVGSVQPTRAIVDSRYPFAAATMPTLQVWAGTAAAQQGNVAGWLGRGLANHTLVSDFAIVLSPGFYVSLHTYADNQDFGTMFHWRERAIEPSETR